jgi:methylisocitrate lyase
MNKAALAVYEACAATAPEERHRHMQTRDELYDFLGYHAYEQKLDALFAQEK